MSKSSLRGFLGPKEPPALTLSKPLPGVLQFGPVTTVGEVLARKPTDPPIKFNNTMYFPTPKQVLDHCEKVIKADESETSKTNERAEKFKGKEAE